MKQGLFIFIFFLFIFFLSLGVSAQQAGPQIQMTAVVGANYSLDDEKLPVYGGLSMEYLPTPGIYTSVGGFASRQYVQEKSAMDPQGFCLHPETQTGWIASVGVDLADFLDGRTLTQGNRVFDIEYVIPVLGREVPCRPVARLGGFAWGADLETVSFGLDAEVGAQVGTPDGRGWVRISGKFPTTRFMEGWPLRITAGLVLR